MTTPSHASILTGTFPQFNHVTDLGSPLGRDLPYLPDILHQHGYRTAAFVGSQVLDPKSATAPGFDRGFDTYDAPFHLRRHGEDRYHTVERRGMGVADAALNWLKGHSHEPFFIWLHFYDPHDPYDPEPPFKGRYTTSPYDGEIAYADSAVGKVLTALRTQGFYDRSLIVVAADHGEAFGEHGERSHGLFLYDETIHVPLLIKPPRSRARHAVIEDRVGLIDIAPTLLQEVGIGVPPEMQGTSLLSLMKPGEAVIKGAVKSAASVLDRPQYAETNYPHSAFGWSSLRAWREGKYLYIDAPKPELYDQSLDSEASHNLFGSSSAVAATMREQLQAFRRKTSRAGTSKNTITPLQVAQLQALGYVSSTSSNPESSDSPSGVDPKDKVDVANSLHQALLETEEENYRDAIPLLQQVLTEEPGLSLANLQLGRALNRLDQYGEALHWLRKAVELTPDSPEARYELGAALQEMGDTQGSAEQFEAATALDPSSDDLHFRLGTAYEEMERIGDAIKQYRAALALNPDNFRANLFLGRRLAMQDQPKEALPLLQKAVALDPQSEDAHKFLGNVYTALGDSANARHEQNEMRQLHATPHP